MKLRTSVALLCLTALLAGCVIRAAQLETLQRLMPTGSADPRLANYAWTLSFNGVQYTVYPTQADGRRVTFVNGNGLRLEWDGESIIVIDGVPGAFGRYESGVEGEERWYARAGHPVVRATCLSKRNWQLSDFRRGWRQECATPVPGGAPLKSTHLVEFDGRGNVSLIEASSTPGATPIALRFIGQRP